MLETRYRRKSQMHLRENVTVDNGMELEFFCVLCILHPLNSSQSWALVLVDDNVYKYVKICIIYLISIIL